MSVIDLSFIKHKLYVIPEAQPMKQWGSRLATENVDVVINEVKKLKEASAITKVLYLSWLSNTTVIKKKNKKWRVCVDFTSPNQAYPKDYFPWPKSD